MKHGLTGTDLSARVYADPSFSPDIELIL